MVPPQLATAIAHRRSGDLSTAERICRQILNSHPGQAETLNLLGMIAKQQGKPQVAIQCLREALVSSPANATFHYNLGTVLFQQGAVDDSIACYRQALRLEPQFLAAATNLGNALRRRGDDQEALEILQQCLQAAPDSAEAHNNVGTALYKLGRLDEALGCFESSIHLKPDHPKAHYNRALTWLIKGEFERGFAEYEWRWKRSGNSLPNLGQPLWDGSPLDGKSILLHAEQGLGDTMQFVRYVPLVEERGGRVTVACQRSLLPMLSHCGWISRLVTLDALPKGFDVHCPLVSLPRICGTTLDSVPASVPYLFADEDLATTWRQRLASIHGVKIGIAWQGSPGYEYDRQRSIPLAFFEPLARLPNVKLVCLQKSATEGNLLSESVPFNIVYLDPGLDDAAGAFMDTAAIMQSLDLVVTSDTSIAHLAGGLGCPVWVALPFMPDWRWLLDRNDSPWYPTMRLFRQTTPGDWSSIFRRMAAELGKADGCAAST